MSDTASGYHCTMVNLSVCAPCRAAIFFKSLPLLVLGLLSSSLALSSLSPLRFELNSSMTDQCKDNHGEATDDCPYLSLPNVVPVLFQTPTD